MRTTRYDGPLGINQTIDQTNKQDGQSIKQDGPSELKELTTQTDLSKNQDKIVTTGQTGTRDMQHQLADNSLVVPKSGNLSTLGTSSDDPTGLVQIVSDPVDIAEDFRLLNPSDKKFSLDYEKLEKDLKRLDDPKLSDKDREKIYQRYGVKQGDTTALSLLMVDRPTFQHDGQLYQVEDIRREKDGSVIAMGRSADGDQMELQVDAENKVTMVDPVKRMLVIITIILLLVAILALIAAILSADDDEEGEIKDVNDADAPKHEPLTPEEEAQAIADLRTKLNTEGTRADREAFQRILASETWQQASPQERAELLAVCNAVPLQELDTSGSHQGTGVNRPMEALAEMAERELNGKPMLLDKAADNGTLLYQLAEIANTQPDQVVLDETGLSNEEILGGLILEINDNGRIAQGNVGTCAATSAQLCLMDQHPAEYARLCRGLLNPGEVAMANGDMLIRDSDSICPTPGNSRTPTERMFQSAVMEYTNDADYKVLDEDGKVDDHHDGSVMDRLPRWARFYAWLFVLPGIVLELWPSKGGGLASHETERAVEALMGEDYYVKSHKPVEHLLDRKPDGDFSDEGIIVGMDWNEGGHALKLEQIIDDPNDPPPRAILHNPWGSNEYAKAGDQVPGAPPGVTWDDPEKGTIAWPLDDFKENIKYAFIPEDL